jgi:hypothetical protein
LWRSRQLRISVSIIIGTHNQKLMAARFIICRGSAANKKRRWVKGDSLGSTSNARGYWKSQTWTVSVVRCVVYVHHKVKTYHIMVTADCKWGPQGHNKDFLGLPQETNPRKIWEAELTTNLTRYLRVEKCPGIKVKSCLGDGNLTSTRNLSKENPPRRLSKVGIADARRQPRQALFIDLRKSALPALVAVLGCKQKNCRWKENKRLPNEWVSPIIADAHHKNNAVGCQSVKFQLLFPVKMPLKGRALASGDAVGGGGPCQWTIKECRWCSFNR